MTTIDFILFISANSIFFIYRSQITQKVEVSSKTMIQNKQGLLQVEQGQKQSKEAQIIIEKQKIQPQLNIGDIKTLIQTLTNKIDTLEQQNKKLSQSFIELEQKQAKRIQKLTQKYDNEISELRVELNLYKKSNDHHLSQIGQKCQVQQNKLMSFIDVVDNYKQKSKSQNELPIDSRVSSDSNKYQGTSKQRLNSERIQDLDLPPVTLKSVLIDHICAGAPHYLIDVNQRHTALCYMGDTGTWTQLLARHSIPFQKPIQYLFKIVKTQTGAISLGIIDKNYTKYRSCNKKQPNCIFYYGGSGRLWQGGNKLQKSGIGFRQGDTVIVLIWLQIGAIRWYVNGKLQAQFNSREFQKARRYSEVQWTMFVNMSMCKDRVNWQIGL